MHIRSLASVAFVAFAAQAFAQQTKVFKRSITTGRDLGLMRRADDGYQPADEVCNKGGNTCAEACGNGYEQCKSTDQAVHCFNPAAGETCCSTTSGNSCLASFYCTHSSNTDTTCCPNGMNLGDCAANHGVSGALTSDPPVVASTSVPPTTTSKSSTVPPTTSSTPAPPTTTSSSIVIVTTSSTPAPSSTLASSTSEVPSTTELTAEISTTFAPSAGTSTAFASSNGTTLATTSTRSSARSTVFPSSATTPASAPNQNAGSSNGPAGMAVLLGAAFAAALL
ncbi:hypothetical protein CORC01_10464 [Colletotrichum orchidophilum]|uniref:Prp 4 CRoW domain-containing protein n=1 Tax=Colletotrichum orchidophilum TaxID=1209926 RepID=A0A1G4AYH7_9PEZI|nr:uncharacterized protein CORC01_10464 [Colletotrichum orchidophilum]OHE94219.1 hypothetical protein CORC01_10464 [Colletotrichum orchidophilum]